MIQECYTMSQRYLPNEVIIAGSARSSLFERSTIDDFKAQGLDFAHFRAQVIR